MLVSRENNTSHHLPRHGAKHWYLTQTSDNKIFQNKNVPDVIREVLKDYSYPVESGPTGDVSQLGNTACSTRTDYAFI